jgi:hypothetical protein
MNLEPTGALSSFASSAPTWALSGSAPTWARPSLAGSAPNHRERGVPSA